MQYLSAAGQSVVSMAKETELCNFADIPEDIGPSYITYEPSLRNKRRAFGFSQECFYFNVCCEKNGQTYTISSRCYRSQKKNEAPHKVHLSVCGDKKKISIAVKFADCICFRVNLSFSLQVYPFPKSLARSKIFRFFIVCSVC